MRAGHLDPSAVGQTSYLVLAKPAEHEIQIKRSRFIACLAPAHTEEQARAHIAAIRSRFPDARHHCSAYILGSDARIQRSNDDGEPAGTAGRPMLSALSSPASLPPGRLFSDVSAVVVRYFGGTLLGTGGLTRAYFQACSQALSTAAFELREQMARYAITVSSASAGKVEHELRAQTYLVQSVDYHGDQARLRVAMPKLGDPRDEAERLREYENVERSNVERLNDQWLQVPLPPLHK